MEIDLLVMFAWVIFPLLLLAICAGLGLLVDALAGRRLPGALVAPAGLAALIVVMQAMTLASATADYAASLAILLAGVGAVATLPWRFGRPGPWPLAAALAVFALFAAPVVLSGDPIFASYGDLGDTVTWLAIAERVVEHGRSLEDLAPSTYKANLDATLAAGEPVGAVLPLTPTQRLFGGEVAWSFQPYLASLGALLSLCVWQLVAGPHGPALDSRSPALFAFLAAVPALVFGYAGWVGVQELTAVTLIALVVALALQPRHGETHSGPTTPSMRFTARAPLGIAALALLAVLAPWPPSFPLQPDAWPATATLAAFVAATVALGLWVASARRPVAFSAFAAALTACALLASSGVSLAPYGQLTELRQVNERYYDQGPALVFERTPYGSRYFLRDVPPDDAADPGRQSEIPLSAASREGEPIDTDQIDFRALLAYSLLVLPRSPEQSRPPLPYRRIWLGEHYEVWRLPPTATFRLLFHMPIGGPLDAAALPNCPETVGLGLLALANQLGAAPQDISLIAAAPRQGDRLGLTVAVPPDRASDLCGRRWDWIEAISPAG
ncbi:MAG TPA: hypothetical protein VNM89_03695 [Solirubrobacterales bacterium]|nr:hypothetical protein [Solirubrobacterales bacterium]